MIESTSKLGGIVRLAVIAAVLMGAFVFSSAVEAAGSNASVNVTATAQNCDGDEEDCGDLLGDSGIGCINGDVVGDVDGTAINCDVDGDVGGTIVNGDATGNVGSCINGDVGSSGGTTINCGVGNSAPEPYVPGGPNPETPGVPSVPGVPGAPGAPGPSAAGAIVVSLPDTGSGSGMAGNDLSVLLLGVAAFALVAAAGFAPVARREA